MEANKNLSESKTDMLRSAISDILGTSIKNLTIEFDKEDEGQKLTTGDGSWDGNIYKYSFRSIRDEESPANSAQP